MIAIRIEVQVGDKIIADQWQCDDDHARQYVPGVPALIGFLLGGILKRMLPAIDKACNERFKDDTPKL